MSELEFQRALAFLLTSGEARRAFRSGDTDILPHQGLAGEQTRELQKINPERMEIFAELLLINRLTKAVEGLPWTTRILGARLMAIANGFNEASPPTHSKKYHEAMAFARFLEGEFRREPPNPPFLADVLTFEMSSLELRFDFNGRYEPSLPDAEALRPWFRSARDLSQAAPQRLSHHRILSLDYNVEWIGEEITRGHIPEQAEKRPMYILQHVEPSGALAQSEINVPTLAFLECCNGIASLSEIVATLARYFQKEDRKHFRTFERMCLDLCQSLAERRVIGLKIAAEDGRL